MAPAAPQRLPEAIRAGTPYSLEALLLYGANPVHEAPGGEAWREALEKVDRRVSPGERERILTCRQRGEGLNRILLADREELRADWKRLVDGSHLLHALPRDEASGLRLNVKG